VTKGMLNWWKCCFDW